MVVPTFSQHLFVAPNKTIQKFITNCIIFLVDFYRIRTHWRCVSAVCADNVTRWRCDSTAIALDCVAHRTFIVLINLASAKLTEKNQKKWKKGRNKAPKKSEAKTKQ